MHTKLMYYFLYHLPCNLRTIYNTALILLQNKALGTYMELAEAKSRFSKMHHYIGFLQIGSQFAYQIYFH